MKKYLLLICCFATVVANAQELYVYTEPASNMPAYSITPAIYVTSIPKQEPYNRFMQRYSPVLMLGVSRKWMVHVGGTFANMHTARFRWESAFVYAKYRLYSHDEIHKHFRVALFGEAAYSRSPFHFDEVSLQGDKSGAQVGVIATQLWHKFALSGSVSHTQVLDDSRTNKVLYIPSRIYQAMNYTLSAGLLLLPIEYHDYKQTNLNFYTELLAQQTLDRKSYYVDLAPSLQVIFNSTSKINIGYRFQLDSDMQRMAKNSFLIGFERTFLNAIKK